VSELLKRATALLTAVAEQTTEMRVRTSQLQEIKPAKKMQAWVEISAHLVDESHFRSPQGSPISSVTVRPQLRN
jgi:hypothetical protein